MIKRDSIFFIIGLLIGFMICYLLFVKSYSVEGGVTNVVVEKNSDEIISQPTTNIKQNNQQVSIVTKLETPYYGTISVNQTINRESLQYNHIVGVGGGVLLKTKMPYIKVDYSYKNVGVELLGGYSFEINDYELGVGAKYIWKF